MCAFVMICTSVIVLPSVMLDGCASDQYTCSNGQCIPLVWECDGFLDCFDSSDEFSCGMCNLRDSWHPLIIVCMHSCSIDFLTGNCTEDQFACDNGYHCIPYFWECDGIIDCDDQSDEPIECRKLWNSTT